MRDNLKVALSLIRQAMSALGDQYVASVEIIRPPGQSISVEISGGRDFGGGGVAT